MAGRVTGVCASPQRGFSKKPHRAIELLKGLGVNGDAHCGSTVRHIFDAKRDPTKPNLRQVHLVAGELVDELNGLGFDLQEGSLGENMTTLGIALDSLPRSARLYLGATAIIEITGLRDPCMKIDRFRKGLRRAVTTRRERVRRFTRGGAMAIVVRGGVVGVAIPSGLSFRRGRTFLLIWFDWPTPACESSPGQMDRER